MSTTYAHKFKCTNCSLHFVIYSWSKDWQLETDEHRQRNGTISCPECGEGSFIRWAPEEMGEHIFQLVPGDAAPASYGDFSG